MLVHTQGSVTVNNIALEDVLKVFISERKIRGLTKTTLNYYSNEVGYFIKWMKQQGVFNIQQITPQLIRDYLIELATHRNKGGITASYKAIKVYMNFYEFEYEPDDYKNPIRKVKIQNSKINPLPGISIENVQKLITACSGKLVLRDKAIFACLYSSGCRANEFVNLNVNDINQVTGAVRVINGKGGKNRTTFINREARRLLRRYLLTHPNDIEALWITEEHERLTYFGLRHVLTKYASAVGIHPVGLHDFRRGFSLNCYRKGIPVLIISTLLGHQNVEVTKRYLDINIDDLRLEYGKFDL